MKSLKNKIISRAYFLFITAIFLSCSDDEFEGPGGRVEGTVVSNNTNIHFILDYPEGPGPFPAVVMGQGSGHIAANTKRNILYAQEFINRGFATMRYDKRGTGTSGGEVVNLDVAESHNKVALMADDMSAVLQNLLGQERIDLGNIGLYGVSQAAWYLPVVAEQNSIVKFMILNSAGVLPMGLQGAYEKLHWIDGLSMEETTNGAENYSGDIGFDQRIAIRNLDIPMLYLLGEMDEFHPLRLNLEELQVLIDDGLDITFVVYPNGTHALPEVNFWPDIDSWHGLP